ncbi:MAG: AI-2E family transporter [Wolbachia sp.]
MQKHYVIVYLILLLISSILLLMCPIIFLYLISIVVVYLFNPLVVKFEKYKILTPIFCNFYNICLLMIFVLVVTFVLPIVYVQITSILNFLVSKVFSLNLKVIPSVLEFFNIIKREDDLLDRLSESLAKNYSDYISYFVNAFDIISNFIIQVLNLSFSLINTLPLVVITLMMFFYLLRDWSLFITKISKLISISYREEIVDYFLKMNFIISNYLKGQENICIFMMIFTI